MNDREQTIQQIFEDFGSFRRLMMSSPEPRHDSILPRAQMEVLFLVSHHDSVNIKDLAGVMRVTGSAATQVIESLVRAELVARRSSSMDRRMVEITLTAKGRVAIEATRRQMLNHISGVMVGLSEQELKTLHKLLQKILAYQSAT